MHSDLDAIDDFPPCLEKVPNFGGSDPVNDLDTLDFDDCPSDAAQLAIEMKSSKPPNGKQQPLFDPDTLEAFFPKRGFQSDTSGIMPTAVLQGESHDERLMSDLVAAGNHAGVLGLLGGREAHGYGIGRSEFKDDTRIVGAAPDYEERAPDKLVLPNTVNIQGCPCLVTAVSQGDVKMI